MNHTHRLIWNVARQAWVVAHEAASSHGQASTTRRARRAASGLGAIALAATLQAAQAAGATPAVNALPTGGQVVAGQASISQSGNAMTIQQGSDKAVLNWNTFNIGSQASVTFQQPSASSVALNRVISADPSAIYGSLRANGQVFLINPSGVIFGAGAKVDVGGLVASSMSLSNDDFLAGRNRFVRDGATGAVVNQGEINAHYVALLAPEVRNEGVITATMGTVALAGGDAVTLGLTGNSLIDITVDKATIDTLVENKHLIQAEGGTVVLSAQSANQLLGRVVNTGAIEATGISSDGGVVRLLGSSSVEHSGSIDASAGTQGHGGSVTLLAGLDNAASSTTFSGSIAARGGSEGGDGGAVETSGSHLSIADAARVDTTSAHGAKGNWLLDPLDFTIAASGGDITGAALSTALGSSNVTITTNNSSATCSGATCGSGSAGNGDILVNDSVSWSSGNTLTLSAWNNIVINKSITVGGTGTLALKYAQQNNSGITDNGDYIVNAPVNLASTAHFTTTYGNDGVADNYTIVTTQAELEGMTVDGSVHYALGANVSATGTWASIGNNITPFEGLFAGLGHTVSGISIGSGSYVGMFGGVGISGVVRDIGVLNASISGRQYVGGVAGYNMGTVFHAYSTGSVTGTSAINGTPILAIGGLVGANDGTIKRSYSAAAVTATSDTGGNTYNGGGADGGIGGLVGRNIGGTVMDSYATGAVSGIRDVGGLIGYVDGSSVIMNTYASGAVSGTTNVGGLTGAVNGTLIGSNNFWDTQTTGQAATADSVSTGKTTAQMKTAATVDSLWDASIWTMADGSYPVLVFSPATGQLIAITITLNNSSRTYGDTTAPTLSGWSITSGSLQSGDTLTGVSFGSALTSYLAAGTYRYDTTANLLTPTLTFASGHSLSDYSITWSSNSLTVNPKTVTITPDSGLTKVYNGQSGTDPTLTYASFASQLVNGDTLTASGALGRAAGNDVGNYNISLGNLASGNSNYTFALTSTPVSFSITPKALSISGTTVASSKVYDGTTSIALTNVGTLSGLEGTETLNVSGSGTLDDINAGSYTATSVSYTLTDGSNGGKASNYSLASQTLNQTVTVDKKSVTLTAPSISKPWDGTTFYPFKLDQSNLSSLNAALGVAGDSVSSIRLQFASPDIGSGITVSASGATIMRSGQDVTQNYLLAYQDAHDGRISQLLNIDSSTLLSLVKNGDLTSEMAKAHRKNEAQYAEEYSTMMNLFGAGSDALIDADTNLVPSIAHLVIRDYLSSVLERIRHNVCPETCLPITDADIEKAFGLRRVVTPKISLRIDLSRDTGGGQ
jgi:filamentous hemagglutinin family protein